MLNIRRLAFINRECTLPSLSQNFDDGKLEVEVTKYFSQFGTVFVKIRRDGRQMPFAFCQFTVSRSHP